MNLNEVAYVPAAQVSPTNTVREAVAAAMPASCDAVAVVEDGKITGIVTSRDILLKVVLQRLDSESTLVSQVMTSPVVTLHPNTHPEEALRIMLEKNIRHLLLSEDGRRPCGMLSLRRLLNFIVKEQRDDLEHVASFLMVDGPGG
jgi:signal-transduction protein with cAMP-binding, CBS, and nucleotidyltransferase domain